MNLSFNRFVSVLLLVVVFLTSCTTEKPAPVSALPGIDIKKSLSDIRAYYNGGVTIEGDLTQGRRAYEQLRSTYDGVIHDLVAAYNICFVNVGETEAKVGNAVMDSNQNSQSLINALVTQSVSAEAGTTKCAEGYTKIADAVLGYRPSILDAYNKYFEIATRYKLYTSNYPEIKVMNDLAQTYGDPRMIEQKLVDAGLPGFTDFAWLPTENLYVDYPGNKAKCDYYSTGEFMQYLLPSTLTKFAGHEESLRNLYSAQWMPQSGANGNCRLFRQAALDELTVSILTTDTQNILNTNTDTSPFATPAP